MYKHILIPTDGSDLSKDAIQNGISGRPNAKSSRFRICSQTHPNCTKNA